MNVPHNPSIAPPAEMYDPDMNPFGHGEFLAGNPERLYGFSDVIDFFDGVPGPAQCMSNFFPSPFVLARHIVRRLLYPPLRRELPASAEGAVAEVVYASGEHCFQAFKSMDVRSLIQISEAPDPATAKFLGRQVRVRPDWQTIKIEVMRQVLAAKFTPGSEMADQLLATGTKVLIEGTMWGDRIWGVYNGAGQNLLGTLLQERRGVLKAMLDEDQRAGGRAHA